MTIVQTLTKISPTIRGVGYYASIYRPQFLDRNFTAILPPLLLCCVVEVYAIHSVADILRAGSEPLGCHPLRINEQENMEISVEQKD